MIEIILFEETFHYFIKSNKYFSMQDINKYIEYFFLFIEDKVTCGNITNNTNNNTNNNKQVKKIYVYGIQDDDNLMKKNNINIMKCVENCNKWNFYHHYNKYSNYGNSKISIYLYNHIDYFVQTLNYIAIPMIYIQIDYFKKYYNSIKPSKFTSFKDKKFVLLVSFNQYKQWSSSLIDKLLSIKHISDTSTDIKKISCLKNVSCYHATELLNIFNEYKFIICMENSLTNGYITEKLFNVFFARSVPIYFGSPDRYRYFNKDSFIDLNSNKDEILKKITFLSQNSELYDDYIKQDKISSSFDNENYANKANDFIRKL